MHVMVSNRGATEKSMGKDVGKVVEFNYSGVAGFKGGSSLKFRPVPSAAREAENSRPIDPMSPRRVRRIPSSVISWNSTKHFRPERKMPCPTESRRFAGLHYLL